MIGDSLRRWEQRLGALALPSPLVWAVLVAAFLGFGVLMGRAAGSDAVDSLASERSSLKLLVAQGPAGDPGATTGSSAVEEPPPSSKPESTPQPAPAPAKSSTPAPASKPASPAFGSSHGSKASSGAGKGALKAVAFKLSSIKHVFVVMLDDQPYATAFGPASPAKYLIGALEKQGELLLRYYAVAHHGLADGIALLSGQGPTEATAANCPTYGEISPANSSKEGQVLGSGCVYPSSTQTLMGQLATKHVTWKAYVEGIDEGTGTAAACAHPAANAGDPSAATLTSGSIAPSYQTWRNPFVYFDAIVGSSTCATHDVGISALKGDLASEKKSLGFSYIVPGPCDDGSPEACAPGRPSGMSAADVFLEKYVPQILTSPAFKKDGLLAITVDNAPSTGEYADASSCCGQPKYPNLPAPTGAAALAGDGGGQVGLLLLSPFIKKRGGLAQETYNHYSLLATIEQIFGLPKLGYAALSEVKPFSASLFSGG